MMRGKKTKHEWDYMGVSKGNQQGLLKGELSFCNLCKKYRVCVSGSGYFFITKKELQELKIAGSESW